MKAYIEILKNEGWQGFKTIASLKKSTSAIPKVKGVYMVIRLSTTPPLFIYPGTGGFYKGKDPNVPISELQMNWNDNSPIIYIGKAGGLQNNTTLKSRLSLYMKFGSGKDKNHWGGRYLWQLKDADELLACWLQTDEEPKAIEALLLKEYQHYHNGKLPFANLKSEHQQLENFEIGPGLLQLLHF